MYFLKKIGLSDDIRAFADLAAKFSEVMFALPSDRLDAACDRYLKTSAKDGTRDRRSNPQSKSKKKRKPVEKALTPDTPIPKDGKEFKAFLDVKENKTSLQSLIGETLIENAPPNKVVVVSGAFEVPLEVRAPRLSEQERRELRCDHEEADNRMVISILSSSCKTVIVESNDPDVFIISPANYHHFKTKDKTVYMKRGQNDYLNITTNAEALLSKGFDLTSLPLFHALCGCDMSSYPYGIGKATAWKAYTVYHGLLDGIDCANPTEEDYAKAEAFMCRMYGDPHNDKLYKMRMRTLLSTSKAEDDPPTSNAAHHHISRSFCQAARHQYAHMNTHSTLPTPITSGGFYLNDSGELTPIMMSNDPMPNVLEEAITCNCEGSCETRRSSCYKTGMKCTVLCHKKLKYSHEKCENILG